MGNVVSIDIGGLMFGCWDRCSRRATCICKLEKNLDALQRQKDNLVAKKNDSMLRVSYYEGQHMVRKEELEVWWRDVDNSVAEADKLLRMRSQEIENLCLGGCCSKSLLSSIKFASKAVGRLDDMAALYSKNIGEVAQPRPAATQPEIPGDQPVGLETMFDKVWGCLADENIGIVGLWGMGGVGKTTLVKQIYNHFYATSKDLELIWVVVSKDFNLDRVQEDIGEKLGLCKDERWKKQTPNSKAISIFNELRNKKFVLILDDIWQLIELNEVGVPRPNQKSESKIIFTTRSESVCGRMRPGKVIKLNPLEPDKAWQLFTQNIEEDMLKIPGIRPMAEDIARECEGLPLALITISGAMSRKKAPQEWNHAREVLRNAASKFEDVEDRVLSKLKFSFDNLPSDIARSCFLCCSLFPEDYKIRKHDLIDYLICEELIKREDDGIHLRDKGYYDIGNLVRACLLEEGEDEKGEYVRMHDVIRDMALWIARSHEDAGERFFVKAGGKLIKVPEVREWQGVKRMSLMENKIKRIEEAPVSPNLSTLFLSGNPLVSIHDDFFQFMNALTVLDLSRTHLEELPLGITNLVSLQSLNLCYTKIRELPLELKRLDKLKCLKIEHTYNLVKIPRNLLSSLKVLQILRMIGCGYFREEEGSEVLAEEVSHLEHLSVLSVTVCDAATLQQLPSCSIHAVELSHFSSAESLYISLLTERETRELVVDDCNAMREFNVRSMRGGEAQATSSMYTSPIIKERSFNSLRFAFFINCFQLLHLTWLILAPNLRRLVVYSCQNMTEIISDEKLREITEAGGNGNLFGKLESLELDDAPNLKSIYREALPFPYLQDIKVSGCPNLKRLPLNSNSAKDCKLVIEGNVGWWNEVEWEDEAAKSTFLPCFQS